MCERPYAVNSSTTKWCNQDFKWLISSQTLFKRQIGFISYIWILDLSFQQTTLQKWREYTPPDISKQDTRTCPTSYFQWITTNKIIQKQNSPPWSNLLQQWRRNQSKLCNSEFWTNKKVYCLSRLWPYEIIKGHRNRSSWHYRTDLNFEITFVTDYRRPHQIISTKISWINI